MNDLKNHSMNDSVALRTLNSRIAECPGDADLLYERGSLFLNLQDLEKCIEDWHRAYELASRPGSILKTPVKVIENSLVSVRDRFLKEKDDALSGVLLDSLIASLNNDDADIKSKVNAAKKLCRYETALLCKNGVPFLLSLQMKTRDSPELILAGWDLFNKMLQIRNHNDDEDHPKKLIQESCVMTRSKDICFLSAKEAIEREWPLSVLLSLMKKHSRLAKELKRNNVGTMNSDSNVQIDDSLDRQICISLLLALRFLGSVDDSITFEILAKGLECSDAPSIQNGAVLTLGSLMADRRQQGSRVRALKNTQGLMRCLEGLLCLFEEVCLQKTVVSVLVVIFLLLSDKERSPVDAVDFDVVVESLLTPYFPPIGLSSETWITGINGLHAVSTASPEAGQTFVLNHNILPLIVDAAVGEKELGCSRLQISAYSCLMDCLKSPCLRNIINEAGHLERLIDFSSSVITSFEIRCLCFGVLSHICIHDEKLRDMMFSRIDFFSHMKSLILEKTPNQIMLKEKNVQRCFSEICFFLSLHEKFKSKIILEAPFFNALKELADGVSDSLNKKEHYTLIPFLFCCTILNLVRSRLDKEKVTFQNKPGGVDLDKDQMEQLEYLFCNLPEQSKPAPNGINDYGGSDLAMKFRKKIGSGPLINILSKIVVRNEFLTPQLAGTIGEVFRLIATDHSLRGFLVSKGAINALLSILDALNKFPDDQRRCKQVLAQLCISINPDLLAYNDIANMIPHLISLLDDSYELYQYESALALTNLSGYDESHRESICSRDGWHAGANLLHSDNVMLRAAALEMWCNLSVSPSIQTKIGQGKMKVDVQLLLAFCLEKSSLRAQSAAAGALAHLSDDKNAATSISNASNFDNLRELLLETEEPNIIKRLLFVYSNIFTNDIPISEDMSKSIKDAVKTKMPVLLEEISVQLANSILL